MHSLNAKDTQSRVSLYVFLERDLLLYIMNKKGSERIFISLGSNQGNRWAHLQRTIFILEEKAGSVLQCSPVYENPAVGFDGAPFYNCCVELETELNPQALLEVLLECEKEAGRLRSGRGYSDRPIDLDLLFYGDQRIENEALEVPHPRLSNRAFVLQPLVDLGIGSYHHPNLEKPIAELADNAPDKGDLQVADGRLFCSITEIFDQLDYLAIEGNIGVGKTSLTKKLAADHNARLLLERFEDNPFLPPFYKDPQRYAFPLEMSFLADRFQQLQEQLPQSSLFSDRVFSDYHLSKSLLFAQVTLEADELRLYRKLYTLMQQSLPQPQLYLYLQQNTERLLENIKKRGRSYEQEIKPDYLQQVEEGYRLFLQQYSGPKLLIDVSDLDFMENPADYHYIIREIGVFLSKK